jgi:hypothetical protein
MTVRCDPPCPIGLVINRVVADRVRALVDEYGDLCARKIPDGPHRTGLPQLLRAVLRSLRLESVDGTRYRLTRRGDDLDIECLAKSPVRPPISGTEVMLP